MQTQNPAPYGSVENPILVNGTIEVLQYFHNLRSQSGRAFFYHRQGTTEDPSTRWPIDVYELIAHDNSERWVLAISPCHSEPSLEVPEGLSMAILPRSIMDITGSTDLVDDFPIGLLDRLKDGKFEIQYDYVKGILEEIPAAAWKEQKVNNILAKLEFE